MAKERKIQDYDPLYSFLRHYVDTFLKLSYRNIRYVGRERIPTDGAVIYAPNHTNALMDALVILAMNRSPKVFVARADIFRNRKLAKIFRFLKILPIMRIRDGYGEVKKNNETIEKAVDVLRDKVPFCIFPEGQHQAKHSSLPLSKGIFRIAFQAQELMPDMPLYIVPVGMSYGNFFRFRSTVRVQVGDPINVQEFRNAHPDQTPQEQMNLLKDELAERMHATIFHIPHDEDYDATYEICAAAVKQQAKLMRTEGGRKKNQLDAHFEANKRIVEHIKTIKANNEEVAKQLMQLGNEASALRNKQGISLSSVSIKYPFWSRLLKILFWIITLPYCLSVSLLTLPINGIIQFLFTKLKDEAFHNSVRYLVHLLMWPILMTIYAVICFILLPWQWAIPTIFLLLPAPIVAHESWRLLRLGISDVKLLACKELRLKYRKIRQLIFNK
ncbi:MAG: 1-acyl-sn-glycerol-3-phosphate acyltransferase [Alistipes sp.]|nr:1-acyl-sn-glycerol-3-phosphate acyltransferase [Alistipes sp.]